MTPATDTMAAAIRELTEGALTASLVLAQGAEVVREARALLGAAEGEGLIDAVRRVVAERDALRAQSGRG